MTEPFNFKGEFHIPKSDKKVKGNLVYNPYTGIELDLMGTFGEELSNKQEIIWGFLSNGKAVTLFNSFIKSKKNNLPGFRTDKYVTNFVFFDIYFENSNDIKFSQAKVRFAHLDEWLNISSGFKITNDRKNYKIKVEYELPEPIVLDLPKDLKLTVNITAKSPNLKLVQKDAHIKQETFINFETPRKRSFDSLTEDIFHFQNLLTLFIQKPIYIKELYGYLRIGNAKNLYKSQIVFQVYNLPKSDKELIPMDMLVPYYLISDKFESLVFNWYINKNKLETATDPFFNTYYNPNIYVSDKYLNLTKSMEAFHRDWIKKKSENRMRYLQVLQEYSKVYNWLLKIKSKPKFVDKLLKYRNDLTHSNPVLKSKNKWFLELHYLCEKQLIIMSCVFLNVIGISKSDLKMFLNETRLYTHIKYDLK